MIKFDSCPSIYWSDITKVNYLQRKILICSITYYRLNSSCLPDFEYDSISKQLVEMQKALEEKDLKKTRYYYVFKDFEGSTGFDLISKLNKKDFNYLIGLAFYFLECFERNE